MKISLIDAGVPRQNMSWTPWVDREGRYPVPPAGLVSLASLVPAHHQVEIIDEKVEGPVETVEADLVGLSFKTMYAKRAYALADRLMAEGKTVVLGGVHATLCPEEAARHGHIVVAGEGEAVWPRVLEDVERGKYQALYRAPTPPAPIDRLPRQRVELLKEDRYFFHATQSARGCAFGCEFCPTRAMFGEGYRLRDLDGLLREIEDMMAIRKKPLHFTDGVFGAGDRDFISALTERLRPLSIDYVVVCEPRTVNDELVRMLASSGCTMVVINLVGSRTPEEIAAIEAVQSQGMEVWGYFMFGFEDHGPDIFQQVIDQVRYYRMKLISLTVMAPFPGTPMGERMAREGRLLSLDSDRYDQAQVIFKPANMTAGELEKGYARVTEELGDLCQFMPVVKGLRNLVCCSERQ